VVGIDRSEVEARVVVASIETYLAARSCQMVPLSAAHSIDSLATFANLDGSSVALLHTSQTSELTQR
jgi:hypothetical protein